jgi:uncharacterized membrane protein
MQVPSGQDGAISLRGTLASLTGGLVVGIWTLNPQSLGHAVLYAGLGSVLDSILGALLQPPLAMNRSNWKHWNILVNLGSSMMTAGLALILPMSTIAQAVCAAGLFALTFVLWVAP